MLTWKAETIGQTRGINMRDIDVLEFIMDRIVGLQVQRKQLERELADIEVAEIEWHLKLDGYYDRKEKGK